MSGVSASAAPPETAAPAAPAAVDPRRRARLRMPLLAFGALGLAAGLCGGLWRLGWPLPHGAVLAELHGPLMVCGLFGTLIGLERAVALGRFWAYLAPALVGLGTLALVAGLPVAVGAAAYVAGAAVLVAASVGIARRQPALFTVTMALGAASWLAGNALWLAGAAVPDIVGWWLAFLILVVAGERLEMSRLLKPKAGSEILFLVAVGLVAAGARNGLAADTGAVLFGLGLLACAAWLFRHDIARRTIRLPGQTRFFAAAMLAGYVWLAVAGLLLLALPPSRTAFGYDAAVHAVAIGFVLSMAFGHALIILPAVVRLRLAYRPVLYGPLALLHGSALLRVAADALAWQAGRQWSGILTVLAIAAFAAALATCRRPPVPSGAT